MTEIIETTLHRLRVGDKVEYRDDAAGDLLTGTIAAITNDEATYVLVQFEDSERELTEEEVKRVP